MIQMQTNLDVADNSGARRVQCIKVLGGSKRKTAGVGDVIIVSVKEAIPRGRDKKGDVHRAVIQGVHIARRHTKPSMGDPGGIVEKELTIHVSNLSHVDPQSGKPTRVGYKFLDDGRKVRFARRSGEMLDK